MRVGFSIERELMSDDSATKSKGCQEPSWPNGGRRERTVTSTLRRGLETGCKISMQAIAVLESAAGWDSQKLADEVSRHTHTDGLRHEQGCAL